MAEVKRGDIWLVSLDPTVGNEIRKLRPAVIIQNDIGNKYSPITIIAPVTSQKLDRVYPFEVLLKKENSKLKKDSKVLLNQIRAIDMKRLRKKVGSIDADSSQQIDEAIKISLGLQ
jgi:mRNA interferase MazF